MTDLELVTYFSRASKGDADAFLKIYGSVCRPMYKIAYLALGNRKDAVKALKSTAADSFTASKTATKMTGCAAFAEWEIKILCTKIKKIFKSRTTESAKKPENFSLLYELNHLSDIDRLILAVNAVCRCSDELTAKLCGYAEETVSICLTNVDVTLKTAYLEYTE